jgi:hypothetical protein
MEHRFIYYNDSKRSHKVNQAHSKLEYGMSVLPWSCRYIYSAGTIRGHLPTVGGSGISVAVPLRMICSTESAKAVTGRHIRENEEITNEQRYQ